MENIDITKMVKKKRSSTLGTTAQAGTPPVQAKPAHPSPVQEVKATELKAEPLPPVSQPKQKEVELNRGLIIGFAEGERIIFQSFGDTLKPLETVGLLEYANTKKNEILSSICATTNYRTEKKVEEAISLLKK